jgi:hypothetical protein
MVPIFVSRETSEKIPTEWLFLRKKGSLTRDIPSVGRLVGLLLLLC